MLSKTLLKRSMPTLGQDKAGRFEVWKHSLLSSSSNHPFREFTFLFLYIKSQIHLNTKKIYWYIPFTSQGERTCGNFTMSAKPSLSRIHIGIPLTKATLVSETHLKRYQQGGRNSAEAAISGGEPSAKGRTKLSLSRQESDAFSKGDRRKVSHGKASHSKSSPDDRYLKASAHTRSGDEQTSHSLKPQIM